MSKMSKNKNKNKKQKISDIFKNNFIMIGKVAKHTPEYIFLMIAEGVMWGFLNSAVAVFNYTLLNSIDERGDFGYAAGIILFMAVFDIAAYAFERWYWCVQNPIIKQKLHMKMHRELFIKARSIDLSCFDDPEFYNDFVWAMNQSDKRAVEVIEDTGKLINRIVNSATLFTILITVDPIVALILFLSSCTAIICNLIGNKISFAHDKEGNPIWRKNGYINRVYHLPDYSKELRTNRASELLLKEYEENMEKQVKMNVKYGKKYFVVYGLGWQGLGHITFFGILLYMVSLLARGEIAVGSFAASIGVIWTIRSTLSDLIERITKYSKHSLYIEKYLEFMRFEPQIKGGKKDIPEFESIELRNVSFSYEFASHPKYRFHDPDHKTAKRAEGKDALKNVNIRISKNDKIAVVGYNGAGKTTLIKLIMRMYDPTEGEILYNGVNIKEYDPEVYRERIGTVFQDFKIFAASIAENVMNGHYDDNDEQKVLDALRAADFTDKLETLEKGIHTPLTREFDDKGTNLSGGESQKVAISRVFAGDYPIIIMDEPSSALDPVAEYNLNHSILNNTEGKTVIFISHRLSTTRIADRIYMFDTGELIEQGSHEELLAMNGKYAEMFRVQSEKYKEQ